MISHKLLNLWAIVQAAGRSSGGWVTLWPCPPRVSGPEKHMFQVGQGSGVGQHSDVLIAWKHLQ